MCMSLGTLKSAVGIVTSPETEELKRLFSAKRLAFVELIQPYMQRGTEVFLRR